jgi:lysine-specific demethylase 8
MQQNSPAPHLASDPVPPQVVGRKYVRLYAPSCTPALYPYQEGLTNNSSQVDLDNPDTHQFPLFGTAKYIDCVLEAGQMLYIPPGWWHYVKSLSVSFSVSFWWA